MKFELNNEIESLTRDIADYKKKILALNENLAKEIDAIDTSKIHQMKKVIMAYAKTNENTSRILEEYIDKNQNFLDLEERPDSSSDEGKSNQ